MTSQQDRRPTPRAEAVETQPISAAAMFSAPGCARISSFTCAAHERLIWRADDHSMRATLLDPRATRSSPDPAILETLASAAAWAEMFSDAPEASMFPIEAAVVARAVAERRREFGTVRYCARQALVQLGMHAVAILPDGDGAPRWPVGFVGSMTHCAGYRAAVVARSGDISAIGIDAEPHAALPDPVGNLILRDEERAHFASLVEADPGLHWDRITFCIKEAVYKAWFPLSRRWLDFDDLSTNVRPNGTFEAHVRVVGNRASGVDLGHFSGRWAVDHDLVVVVATPSATSARTQSKL